MSHYESNLSHFCDIATSCELPEGYEHDGPCYCEPHPCTTPPIEGVTELSDYDCTDFLIPVITPGGECVELCMFVSDVSLNSPRITDQRQRSWGTISDEAFLLEVRRLFGEPNR